MIYDAKFGDSFPSGCNKELYLQVLELMERRLVQEEELTDFKRHLENIKRSQERHRFRERQIDTEPNNTIVQIQTFRRKKKKQIDELHVIISTSANRIYLWENTDPKEKPYQNALL